MKNEKRDQVNIDIKLVRDYEATFSVADDGMRFVFCMGWCYFYLVYFDRRCNVGSDAMSLRDGR